MTTKVKRRLTCILCADVKSYTRLMESDETRTIGTLRQYRAAMDALVERHDGRTINTWGDAVIAEFASVVEAVQCAIEVQRELAARNRELPEAEQMWFRIGINLGDVMVENDDLYGEGVNIAARLQELAEPGGILISGSVHDLVRNKLSVGFDYLGQQPVKNVSEPVTSYRIVLDGDAPRPIPKTEGDTRPETPSTATRRPNGIPEGTAARLWSRFLDLPGRVKIAILLIPFLFLIDMLDGGESLWFYWPMAGLGFYIVLWISVLGHKKRQ
ncbi:adenylate/guanylate cyclase domain-containing protein [Dongia deserti]|uniref:adenylate/guanylate cyclase domain-containing protein n=1 Tax=Dongia deserti TaxID=2268030 RepID=UPI000E646DA0|nr:adenylate/guanylate cyclase domain-containing protein [Dongia deserti]